MKSEKLVVGFAGLGIVGYLAIVLIIAVGWVMNLVALCKTDFKPSYKAEVLRGVGVLAPPLGGILGYIPIADGEVDANTVRDLDN